MNKEQGYRHPLAKRVLQFIKRHQLVLPRQTVLVAVSGGQDSVCLLSILIKLQKELDINIHVCHLNHQLRGADSEADARYVNDLADRFGVPVIIESRDVKSYQAKQRISLEEAAREVRYNFFAEVAAAINADCVAVGHTVDDHIETFLMHLIRGSGTRGLRGLQPAGSWRPSTARLVIIRPLLPLSRRETADYCLSHRLEPRIDTTNFSMSPLRNRIRHQLLPLLQSYNPRVVDALLRTTRFAGEDLDYLEQEVTRISGSIIRKQNDTVILDKATLLNLHPTLQRHLLRQAIESLLGNIKDIEARHIKAIIAALLKPAGRRFDLPGGLFFSIEYDRYLLGTDPQALSPFPPLDNEFVIKIPGETLIYGWRITATIIPRQQIPDKDDRFSACFDFDKTGDKISVRNRRSGDRFQPLGMTQTKKLGKFMIDTRIPQVWRLRVPVVTSSHHIIWIVGFRVDERTRVTAETNRVLYLEFERTADT